MMSAVTMDVVTFSNNSVESYNRWGLLNRPHLYEMNAVMLDDHFRLQWIRDCFERHVSRHNVETIYRRMLRCIFSDEAFLDRLLRETPTIASIIARYGENFDPSNSDISLFEREILYTYLCRNR